jgi:hypothetical protein
VAGNELAHPAEHHEVDHHGAGHDEPVTSPDQHKPMISRKLALFGAFATIILLPVLAFVGNHEGNVEKIFLVGIAAIMLLWVILDWVLHKLGLRN